MEDVLMSPRHGSPRVLRAGGWNYNQRPALIVNGCLEVQRRRRRQLLVKQAIRRCVECKEVSQMKREWIPTQADTRDGAPRLHNNGEAEQRLRSAVSAR